MGIIVPISRAAPSPQMDSNNDEDVCEGYGGMDVSVYEAIVTFKRTGVYPKFCDLRKNRNAYVNFRKKCDMFMITESDVLLHIGNGDRARVVVRRGDVRTAIKVIHLRHNHAGQKFTIMAVNRRLYWRRVRRDVTKFVSEDCEYCIRSKVVKSSEAFTSAYANSESFSKCVQNDTITEAEEAIAERLLLNCSEDQMEQLDNIIKQVKESHQKAEEMFSYVEDEYVLEEGVFVEPTSEDSFQDNTLAGEFISDVSGSDTLLKVETVFERDEQPTTSNNAPDCIRDDLSVSITPCPDASGNIEVMSPIKLSRKRHHQDLVESEIHSVQNNKGGSLLHSKDNQTRDFESVATSPTDIPSSSYHNYSSFVEEEIVVGTSSVDSSELCHVETLDHEEYEDIGHVRNSQNTENDHSLYAPSTSSQSGDRRCNRDRMKRVEARMQDNLRSNHPSFTAGAAALMSTFDPEVIELQKNVLRLQQEVLLMQRDYMRQKLANLPSVHYVEVDQSNLDQHISQMEGPDVGGTIEIIE